MAVNKRKVLEAARKHVTKGAKDKALKEYDTLLKLDPRDSKLRLEVGDAYRRWGQVAEASETYLKVAEQFMKEGFDARAVAVYKQILNLDSESFSCYEPLAELYQRMGLTGEATSALQTAADGYHRAGDKTAALSLLRKMAMLEPSNTTSRLKVADLLHKEGMNQDALVEYEAVVEELLAQGDAEAVSMVYERLLEVEPDRLTSLIGYARNLIDRGAADRAEPFARRALEADPSPPHYELLGEVLRATGKDEELVDLYRNLAELYRERGDEERTREILQRYVPPEEFSSSSPSNGYLDENELSPELDGVSGDLGADPLDELDELSPLEDDGREDFGDESSLLDHDLMADDSQMLGNGESGLGIIANLDSPDAHPLVDPNAGTDSSEMTRIIPEDAVPQTHDVDQLFAEASVYLRYGKRDQAITNLKTVLEADPGHRGALEKLGEAYVEAEDTAGAVEMWSRAAKLAVEQDEMEAASAIRDRIAAIDAGAAAELVLGIPSKTHLGDPDTEESPIPDDLLIDVSDDSFGESLSGIDSGDSSQSDLAEIEFDDIEIDVDDASFTAGDSESPSDEPQAEVTASDSIGGQASEALTFDGSVERDSNPQKIGEDVEEADFYMEQGLLDEAEAIYTRVLEVAPNHPHALVRMGEIAAQRGTIPGSSGTASEAAPPETVVDRAIPEAPDSTNIGEPLPNWDDDLSLSDELDIGPIDDDLDGDDNELSAADLSVGSFDPIDATRSRTDDAEGDTRDLPELSDEADSSFGEIEVEMDEDIDVDFELPEVDSDAGGAEGESPVANSLPQWELDAEEAEDESAAAADDEFAAEAAAEPAVEPDPQPRENTPALAVTNIDFGEEEDLLPDADDPGEMATPSDIASENATLNAADPATDLASGLASDLTPDLAPDSISDDDEQGSDGESFGFDLAAAIGQSLDDDPNENSSGNASDTSDDGFAAVFAEFKKGVDEALNEGDFEAHYDLGIAYREMGLLDDAMSEFQAAMGNPNRRLGCLHLLGLCALDAGRPEDAIAHLQTAIETDDLEPEQLLALRFDLGRCFERSGDLETAKVEYLAVQAQNPGFSDVGARLEALDDPEKPVQDETEYESFDDFFGDSADDDEDDAEEDEASEPESYESFDDVIAESDADDENDADIADVEMETAADSEIAIEPEPDLEPEPGQAPETVREIESESIAAAQLEPDDFATEIEAEPELPLEPELEMEPTSVSEPEPEPDPEPDPEPEPTARKKRKISFF